METITTDAYCVNCRQKHEFTGVVKVSDSGRRMAQGKCPVCDQKVNRILGKEADRSRWGADPYTYVTETVIHNYAPPAEEPAEEPVYSQKNRVGEGFDPELRHSGYMTIDEFVSDLSIGIREYLIENWRTKEDAESELYHPEDLIYNTGAFVDSLAISLSIFGSKARA